MDLRLSLGLSHLKFLQKVRDVERTPRSPLRPDPTGYPCHFPSHPISSFPVTRLGNSFLLVFHDYFIPCHDHVESLTFSGFLAVLPKQLSVYPIILKRDSRRSLMVDRRHIST